jgi:hypothetical protein
MEILWDLWDFWVVKGDFGGFYRIPNSCGRYSLIWNNNGISMEIFHGLRGM